MAINVFVEFAASTAGLTAAFTKADGQLALMQKRGKDASAQLGVVGGLAVAAIGAAVVGVTAKSVEMASEFEKSTSLLVTAAGESSANLGKVRQGILDIAASTGTTWQNLSEGMYTVEKAGYRGSDALKVLKASAQGAAEEGANLSDVTNAMTSVMASYGLHADHSVQVMNALKTAAGATKDTMQNFSSSLSTVLPVAASAGLSFDQVGAAIATLSQHGTSAFEATQELSNTIRNLQAPNRVAATEMQNLGINVQDLSSHLGQRGLAGTLDVVLQAMARNSSGGRVMLQTFNQSKTAAQDAAQMFDHLPPAAHRVAQAVEDGTMSFKEFRKTGGGLSVTQKSLTDQWATMYEKSQGFTNALRSGDPVMQTQVEALKKMMGGSTGLNTALMLTGTSSAFFAETQKRVAASLHDNATAVEGWDATSKLFSVQMGMARQAVDGLAIKFGMALLPALEHVAAAFASGATFLSHHMALATALATVIGGTLTAVMVAYAAQMARSAAETVARFAVMIAEGTTWAVAQATSLAETAALWVMYAAEHAAATAGVIAQNVAMAASATVAFIAENAATLGIVAGLALLVAGIVYAATHWTQVWGWIKDAATTVWDALKETWAQVAGWLSPVGDAFQGLWTDTVRIFDGIAGFFEKWWPLLLVIFLPGIAVLVSVWNHYHTQIVDTTTSVWNWVHSHFLEVVGWLRDFFAQIGSLAQTGMGNFRTQIINPVTTAAQWVTDKLGALAAFVGQVLTAAVAAARTTWGAIQSAIVTPVAGAAAALWAQLSGWAAKLAGYITAAINAAKSVAATAVQIGQAIIDGMVHGIEGAAGALGNAVTKAANGALNAAKGFLGIHSPSRVFADQVGAMIPAGIAVGIAEQSSAATGAAATAAAATVSAAAALTRGAVITPTAAAAAAAASGSAAFTPVAPAGPSAAAAGVATTAGVLSARAEQRAANAAQLQALRDLVAGVRAAAGTAHTDAVTSQGVLGQVRAAVAGIGPALAVAQTTAARAR